MKSSQGTPPSVSLLTLLGLAACGPQNVAAARVDSEAPGTISGHVRYHGAMAGPLVVGAFRRFPPVDAPAASVTLREPAFPVAYRISGLAPGRYFVLGIIPRDPARAGVYRPSIDAGGAVGGYVSPAAVSVTTQGGVAEADFDLVDPDPRSPWVSETYR